MRELAVPPFTSAFPTLYDTIKKAVTIQELCIERSSCYLLPASYQRTLTTDELLTIIFRAIKSQRHQNPMLATRMNLDQYTFVGCDWLMPISEPMYRNLAPA